MRHPPVTLWADATAHLSPPLPARLTSPPISPPLAVPASPRRPPRLPASYCVYAFVWLLPAHQNTVSGLAAGVVALSDVLALLAVWADRAAGVSVEAGALALAALAVAAACALLLPSRAAVLAAAARAMEGGSGGGAPEDAGAASGEERSGGEIARAMRAIAAFPHACALVIGFSIVYCLALMMPIQDMLFYYEALFARDDGVPVRLVNEYAVVCGVGGFVCAWLGGRACDAFGVVAFVRGISVCCLTTSALLLVPTPAAQLLAQVAGRARRMLGCEAAEIRFARRGVIGFAITWAADPALSLRAGAPAVTSHSRRSISRSASRCTRSSSRASPCSTPRWIEMALGVMIERLNN